MLGRQEYSRRQFLYHLNDLNNSFLRPSENFARIMVLIDELNWMTGGEAERLTEVNDRMKLYRPVNFVCFRQGELRLGQMSSWHAGDGTSAGDHVLWSLLTDAFSAGDIRLLARCEWPKCRRWWFKRRPADDHFCRRQCRQAAHRSTPQFKEERNRKAKERREYKQAQLLGITVKTLRAQKKGKKQKKGKRP